MQKLIGTLKLNTSCCQFVKLYKVTLSSNGIFLRFKALGVNSCLNRHQTNHKNDVPDVTPSQHNGPTSIEKALHSITKQVNFT